MLSRKKIMALLLSILLVLCVGGSLYFHIEERRGKQREEERAKASEFLHEDLQKQVEENNKKDLQRETEDVSEEDWENYAKGNFDKISPQNIKIIEGILFLEE